MNVERKLPQGVGLIIKDLHCINILYSYFAFKLKVSAASIFTNESNGYTFETRLDDPSIDLLY